MLSRDTCSFAVGLFQGLFPNRSQKTSTCGKNVSDTLAFGSCATFLFLPHFDVIFDLLLSDVQQHGIHFLNINNMNNSLKGTVSR